MAIAAILNRSAHPPDNLSRAERRALKSLKGNEDIVIVPADKGNTTVVLDADAYDSKAFELLQCHPFTVVNRDPTRKVEELVNACVREFFRDGKIKKHIYDYLRRLSCLGFTGELKYTRTMSYLGR